MLTNALTWILKRQFILDRQIWKVKEKGTHVDRNSDKVLTVTKWGFPGGAVVKNLPVNARDARDTGLIAGLGRPPGEGNGNHLQYSCLEHSMDRVTWWATVHGVAKSQTWPSNWAYTHITKWVTLDTKDYILNIPCSLSYFGLLSFR